MENPIPFQPLLRNKPVEIYTSGHLPHWRQAGCTYFVTFRTADSLPRHIARRLADEKSLLLKQLGKTTAQLTDPEKRQLAKKLSVSFESELDDHHGKCVLKDQNVADYVARALHHFDHERYHLGDFVIMPNHVHLLLTPLIDFSLETILHSLKRYTATMINKALKQSGPFWQRDSYDHIVRDSEQLLRFQDYIANNPANAGIAPGEKFSYRAAYEFTA